MSSPLTGPAASGPTSTRERPTLDNKKFKDFLTHFEPDEVREMTSPEKLDETHEKFKAFEEVRDGISRMWPDHIERMVGVKLDKEGKQAVETFLVAQLKENPDAFLELKTQMDTFRNQRAEIRDLESRLSMSPSTAKVMQDYEKQARDLKALRVTKKGWFGNRIALNEEQARLIERYGGKVGKDRRVSEKMRDKIAAEIENRHAALNASHSADAADATTRLEAARAVHDEARGAIVGKLLEEETIAQKVQEAVGKKFETLLTGEGRKGFKAIAEASEVFRKFSAFAEGADASDALDVDAAEKQLNELVEARAKDEIKKAMEKLKPRGTGTFSKLDKKLSEFINMNPIGSKEHDDAREFVLEALGEELEKLDEKMEDGDQDAKLKYLMLGTIVTRLEHPAP